MAISGSGEAFPFDRLLLATGSEPVTLAAPGFDRPNVHTLRSLADARRIIAQAQSGARAVVIGSRFIGLEAAAAPRAPSVSVAVISKHVLPFAPTFRPELGGFPPQ